MSDHYEPWQGWAFAWAREGQKPFVCHISASTRREAIKQIVAFMGQDWRKIRRQGGRVVRVIMCSQEKVSAQVTPA